MYKHVYSARNGLRYHSFKPDLNFNEAVRYKCGCNEQSTCIYSFIAESGQHNTNFLLMLYFYLYICLCIARIILICHFVCALHIIL